jgi:hypothetical protein
MQTQELRSEPRIPISQRGTLKSGEVWYPCLVQDMSKKGFFIVSSRNHSVGQALDFRCAFFPEKHLECKVEVRHVNDDGVGTKIVQIDQKGIDLCQLFLQEQFSDKLNRSG